MCKTVRPSGNITATTDRHPTATVHSRDAPFLLFNYEQIGMLIYTAAYKYYLYYGIRIPFELKPEISSPISAPSDRPSSYQVPMTTN